MSFKKTFITFLTVTSLAATLFSPIYTDKVEASEIDPEATSSSDNLTSTKVSTFDTSSNERFGEVVTYIDNKDPKTITDSSYEEPQNRIFVTEEFAKSKKGNTVTPYYGESEKSTVKKTEYHTKKTIPTGQNPGGTKFSSGGGFYVNLSGGTNVSFSVGTSWGPVSYSVSVGQSSTSNIGGVYAQAGNRTNYFKAQIDRTIRYRRVLVDQYQYGQYKSSYWTTWKDIYKENVYTIKV